MVVGGGGAQSPSCVRLFTTPWTAARQASPPHHLWEFAQVFKMKLMTIIKGMS